MSVRGYLVAIDEIIKQDGEEFAFKVYVTDSLHLLGKDKYITERYVDLINTTPAPPEDDRSCMEITQDVFSRIRGEID